MGAHYKIAGIFSTVAGLIAIATGAGIMLGISLLTIGMCLYGAGCYVDYQERKKMVAKQNAQTTQQINPQSTVGTQASLTRTFGRNGIRPSPLIPSVTSRVSTVTNAASRPRVQTSVTTLTDSPRPRQK